MKHELEFRMGADRKIISLFVCDMYVTIWSEENGLRPKDHFQNPFWSSLYKPYAYVTEHYESIIEQAKCILVKEML